MGRGGCLLLGIGLLLAALTTNAQDGLNLPTELYVLSSAGVVQRFGLGAAGVETVAGGEDAFILDFAVAPDGVSLAYRTLEGLFLADMYARQRRTAPPIVTLEGASAGYPEIRGRGDTIAWSPTGTALAYATVGNLRLLNRRTGRAQNLDVASIQDLRWSPDGQFLAAGAAGNIWWFYFYDGAQARLISAITDVTGIAWLPDNRVYVAFASGGLNLLDILNRSQQTVVLPADAVYSLPYVMESDLYVFQGMPDAARLLVVRAQETQTLSQAPLDISAARWSPDGRSLVAFRGGAMALIEPISGQSFTLPVNNAAAYSWGVYRRERGTVARWGGAYILADAPSTGVAQVWRVPDNNALPETITPAVEDITEFAVSGDGRRMAYVSGGALFYFTVGGSPTDDLFRIAESSAAPTQPAFSADGQRLYYRLAGGEAPGIYFADLTSGQSFPLVLGDFEQPQPAPALGAVLLHDAAGQARLFDANTGEEIGRPIRGQAKWLGGALYAVFGDQVTLVDASTGQVVRTLLEDVSDEVVLDAALLNRDTLRLLIKAPAPAPVVVLDALPTATTRAVIGFLDTPRLSPDGQFVLGLTHPGGSLIVVDVASRQRQQLDTRVGVRAFAW
jgi:hypothetical protein